MLGTGNSASSSSFYLADINASDQASATTGGGTIRIIRYNNGIAQAPFMVDATPAIGIISPTETIGMVLTGTYGIGGALTLNFTVSDGVSEYSVSAVDNNPLTGGYFGLRNRNNSTSAQLGSGTIEYSSYQLESIPEPSVFLLGALGMLGISLRRRA